MSTPDERNAAAAATVGGCGGPVSSPELRFQPPASPQASPNVRRRLEAPSARRLTPISDEEPDTQDGADLNQTVPHIVVSRSSTRAQRYRTSHSESESEDKVPDFSARWRHRSLYDYRYLRVEDQVDDSPTTDSGEQITSETNGAEIWIFWSL